jgi:uncharacterized membrane protein HdeD (DUF308 family)
MELADEHIAESAAKWWWVFLITGILWIILSLVIFQFNLTSALTTAILVGVVVLIAGINEFIQIGISTTGWKWVHGILGVLFVLFGIYSFIYPGITFVALVDVVAWLLLFKGIFDIVLAFATMQANHLWWLWLILGGLELGLAWWAMGHPGRSAYIVIVWVGVWAMLRGITEIILAFHARSVHKALTHGGATPPPPAAAAPAAT